MSRPRAQATVRTGSGGKGLVAIAALVLAVLYTWKANGLSMGSMERPGPGLFPMVVGAFFVVMCCVAFLEARLEGRREAIIEPSRDGDVLAAAEQDSAAAPAVQQESALDYRLLAGFLTVITFHVLSFVPLGFVVSTFLSLAAISTLLGHRTRSQIIRNVVFAAILTMLLYVIFGVVLDISLPAGIYAPTVQ